MSEYEPERDPEPSGWAIAGVSSAAVMLMTIGIFQALAGLAAIINDDFYVVGNEYAFNLDVTGGAGSTSSSASCLFSGAGHFSQARPGRASSESSSRS